MNKKFLFIGAGAVFLIIILLALFNRPSDVVNVNENAMEVEATEMTARQLYEQGLILKKDKDMVEAKEFYQKILVEHSDYEDIESVQNELEELNMNIIFSNVPTPVTVVHEVKSGDTLGKLAKKYSTTVELTKISNNLNSDIIRIGQKLRIWTGSFNVFVDKSQNLLFLKQNDEILKTYIVATGENNSTPVGEFKIGEKLVDPVWFHRGVVVPPESPQNVLGTRWMGFSNMPGYGIHGTIEPETIGQHVTAGCVRMRNEEVEELYSIIPRGTLVVVVD